MATNEVVPTIGPEVPDSLIPVTLAPSSILHARRRRREIRMSALYLPGMPIGVCKRVFAISATAPLLLQVIGLQVRFSGLTTVAQDPAIIKEIGIPERTARRTLRALEAAGMVQLGSAAGRRPSVTVTDREYVAWLLPPGR